MFKDRILLISGGSGSFGNAVLRRFLSTDVGEIRVLSRDEKKQDDMRKKYQNPKLKFFIGDVRDRESVDNAMCDVDFVFHAAALKQVPSCEFFPLEATKTNVFGTANVVKSAIQYGVRKVICLSTDKAAYPINAMGMSKALMEKVVFAESRNVSGDKTLICCTRYGNVMASRGSVIPLFVDQIEKNVPITITDPEMTRFMMNLDDAVKLVVFAFENAKQGDLLIQKSPAATIGNLAKVLKEIKNSNVETQIIGTRHGEKLYETLLTREEFSRAIDLGEYYRVPADNRDLNYEKFMDQGDVQLSMKGDDYNSHNTTRMTNAELKQKLLPLMGQ